MCVSCQKVKKGETGQMAALAIMVRILHIEVP